MAVAAYASLLSLTHVLENLHYRAPFQFPLLDIKLVESLQKNVQFLLDFVELHSEMETPDIESLWRSMAKVAFETEEMIDSHVVNLLYFRSLGETSVGEISALHDDTDRIISKMNTIKKDLPEINEACKMPAALVPTAVAPSAASSSGKTVVVGFDGHVIRIKDLLTRNKSDLQVLSIVGMGGIGKTTLARCVFDDPYIDNYFDRRIWLTISQDFSVEQIFKGLLAMLGNEGTCERSINELGGKLYQELFGRRYLIIMDDMWSTEAWDELKRYFPDNGNASRVLVTTRISDVATCLGSLEPYTLGFLGNYDSWNLLCQITFAPTGNCTCTELERIGREIAKSCRGLPLEISVIGHLLAKSDMTPEFWGIVAKDISSFGNLEDSEHCLKVLSLSYKSLSINLKLCFLYLRRFREDEDVRYYELLERWVAEGFIKPERDKSLEELSEQYFLDLVSRNLIFIKPFDCCGIHDLLRDLCVRESNKEGFIESPRVMTYGRDSHWDLKREDKCCLCGCRLCEGDGMINIGERIIRFPPSSQDDAYFACDACQSKYAHITSIKVVMAMKFWSGDDPLQLPTEIRALAIDRARKFQMVHLLWNLQAIYIPCVSRLILPPELWEMPQLREIMIERKAFLPNPEASHIKGQDFMVLKNLQSLSCIKNFQCTKQVVDRLQNLKVLRIRYRKDESMHTSSLCNLAQLQNLQFLWVKNASESITFPNSLKKLSLLDCQMTWEEDMSIIGSLPVLEDLELHGNAIKGSEWNSVEGEFVGLKKLRIRRTGLKCWRADSIHFPVLESLALEGLGSLEVIPAGIDDIPSLQEISVNNCNESLIKSALRIHEDQREMGNETLKIYITGQYEFFNCEPLSTDDDAVSESDSDY